MAPFSVMLVALVGILLVSMIAPFTASAQSAQKIYIPPAATENAALQYWRAFAVLPQVDDSLRKVLENPATTALGDPEPIPANLPALHLLRLGARQRMCDWGIDYTVDGPGTLMPHLSKARELGKIASLRARIDASKNQPESWRINLAATLRLARDVGNGPLICRLVQGSMETTAYDCAAPDVPTMDSATLKEFAGAIDELAPSKLSTCMVYEKDFFRGWIMPKLQTLKELSTKDPIRARDLQHELRQDLTGLGLKDDEQPALDPADTPAKITALIKQIEAASANWDRVGKAFDLPLEQSLGAIDKIDREKEAWPPVVKMFMPSARAFRISIARGQTRTAMFRAGLAVVLDGQDALKNHPDPSTGKAFTYKALGEHAFELGSAMNLGGTPIAMTFGRVKTP